jgi:hypothetical protein
MVVYYVLFIAFLGSAGLNMLHVSGGFFTDYAADLVCPAWLNVVFRGLHGPYNRKSVIQRTFGRTPEIAALSLFVASTLTEVTQLYWPHGVFSGRFDPIDVVAYASGLALCYAADKGLSGEPDGAPNVNRQPAA